VSPAVGRAPFRTRLRDAVAAHGPLCVGIDPHPGLLSGWGLDADPSGVERFARGAVEALAGHVAVLKPQVALFEVFGAAGLAALERTLADARDAGVLTIADAKRGDIGSTMAGYARAWLADDAPLASDAMTLSPYLGVGALAPALDLAAATGRGVFVLARTSNPEAAGVQSAQAWVAGSGGAPRETERSGARPSNRETERSGARPSNRETERSGARPSNRETERSGARPSNRETERSGARPSNRETERSGARPSGRETERSGEHADEGARRGHRRMREVAQSVVDALADHNAAHRDGPGDGSAGAVVGLTRGTTGRDHGLDLRALGGPVLVPGLGAQGGRPADVVAVFGGSDTPGALGASGGPVVPVSAREVLTAGPDHGALRAAVGALNGALTG
jgi:orotidine-5'-phosphate decarboxylase